MTTAQGGYPPVHRWVKPGLGPTPTTGVVTIAWAALCLLVAHRVTAAALARALAAEHAGAGRSCLRRGRRWWSGPALAQGLRSPAFIRVALPVLARDQSVVGALDTTRRGPWEGWLAGRVIAGRPLPIGWAVIPSPWPKGRFRVTTLALSQQLQPACPTEVRWTLGADRGLPSARLFAQVRQGGTACSVRWRWRAWALVDRVYAPVRAHLAAGRLVVGQRTAATRGRGPVEQPRVAAAIVVSAAVVTPPRHQQTPGTARAGAPRQAARPAPQTSAGPHAHSAQRGGPALGPDLGLVHPRADGSAGGGRVCGAEVDRRDLPSLASSLGRPRHGGRHANRGPGGTADGDCWPRRHGAEALGPTGECRPRGPATASARDRDGPGQLVWVRSTAV